MSSALTPSEWEEMSEQEREEFKENQKARLDGAINEELNDLEDSESEAIELLSEGAEEGTETHTVELTGGVEVEVIDTLPGRLERQTSQIRNGNVDEAIQSTIDVITHLIQTKDPAFDSEAVWWQFVEEYGTGWLNENALKVTEPYYERQKEIEKLGNSRGRTGGR